MYKEIELETQEGKKTFPFLATGTTAYRYKQCFHQDLMIGFHHECPGGKEGHEQAEC